MHEGLWTGNGEGELTVDPTHIGGDIYAISINTIVPMQEDGLPGFTGELMHEAAGL